jgi:3-hydroxyacyl-[acyl-carrier-protein] dehydratase
MRFELLDRVLERSDDRIVTLKQVTLGEEYLQDHFPGFPVLPGVMMLEAMVQAGRALLRDRTGERLVLGEVRALKYGTFVTPGQGIRVEIDLQGEDEDGSFDLKGRARVVAPSSALDGQTAVSGRMTLRPVRLGVPAPPPAASA